MDTALIKTLGQKIRQRRRALSLSQEELGHRSGVDRSYISGLERGVRNPTFSLLSQVAGALGCEVAELLKDPAAGAEDCGEDFGAGFGEALRLLWRGRGE